MHRKMLPSIVCLSILIVAILGESAITAPSFIKALAATADATGSTTQGERNPVPDQDLSYRVAFLAEGDALNVRTAPGIQAEVLEKLPNHELVLPLGKEQLSDDATWVQIRYHDTKIGWVNRSYLAASRERSTFCGDPRPRWLITNLRIAIADRDGQKLAQLVAPRGLYLALAGDRTLFFSPAEVRGFFEDHALRDWGREGYSGRAVQGTLADSVVPLLQRDLLPGNIKIACNNNQDEDGKQLYGLYLPGIDLLAEPDSQIYSFYSVLRPGKPGNDLAWSAWGLLMEYWNGYPVITGMVNYYWTP